MNSTHEYNNSNGSRDAVFGSVVERPDSPIDAGQYPGALPPESKQTVRSEGHREESGEDPRPDFRALQVQVTFLRKRETLLSKMLFEARDQLQSARAEVAALRAGMWDSMSRAQGAPGVRQGPTATPAASGPLHGEIAYSHLVQRIREVVATTLPTGAIVAVVSRGDDGLLELGNRQGWHFPQTQDGVYAGFYPTESKTAIGHLESLRTKGAGYLLFPATALWWLDHYHEFSRYLNTRFLRLWDDDCCLIYQLEAL